MYWQNGMPPQMGFPPPQQPYYVYVPQPMQMPPTAGPTSSVDNMKPRQIKKAIKFYQGLVKELEDKSKGKEKKDEKKDLFSKTPFLLVYTLLVAAWPFTGALGLLVLKQMLQ